MKKKLVYGFKLKFLIEWHQPHSFKTKRLEMTDTIRSLLQIKKCRSLIEDGALVYCASTKRQWHTKQGINLFGGWPGNNPNLNTIELLWSQMKQLGNKDYNVSSRAEKNCLNLGKILSIYLKSLYKSMARRLLL